MRKKRLVYKSKHGDIPVILRDYIPDDKLYFFSGEPPIDIFDQKTVELNTKAGLIKKVRFITKFAKRRFGKIVNIKNP